MGDGVTPRFGTINSTVNSINHGRHIVGAGYSSSPQLPSAASMWTPAGGMIDLGTLPGGGGQNVAAGMNGTGQVVGWSGRRIDERAVVWTAGSGRVGLRSLGGVYP